MASLNEGRKRHRNRGSQLSEPQKPSIVAPLASYIGEVLRNHHLNLYTKYSSSQNFYFTRQVNDLLDELPTPQTIRMKDLAYLDREEELLKSYNRNRIQTKQRVLQLCEYFKYYNNSPQFFMRPACAILRQYAERKKMLLYRKITREAQQIKEDSEEYRSTNNHESQNRVLDYFAKAKIRMGKFASGKKASNTGVKPAKRDSSFEDLNILKEKLGKVIRSYEKKTPSRLRTTDLPEAHQHLFTFDSTVGQLSTILSPTVEPKDQDIYGLNIFKEVHLKKRKNKKSQILQYGQQPKQKKPQLGKSASKKLQRNKSLVPRNLPKDKSERKLTPVRGRPSHKRTLSSEASMKSPKMLHKYTSSNK